LREDEEDGYSRIEEPEAREEVPRDEIEDELEIREEPELVRDEEDPLDG
jgi:hypothetical protein